MNIEPGCLALIVPSPHYPGDINGDGSVKPRGRTVKVLRDDGGSWCGCRFWHVEGLIYDIVAECALLRIDGYTEDEEVVQEVGA